MSEPPADDEAETREPSDVPNPRSGFRVAGKRAQTEGPRYERGRELARGGLGKITSARDTQLRREVAIKELHQHSEHARRRFEREGFTTARLQHPAIVPIIEAGTWDSGDPYLVMKLLEGKTLGEEIVARKTVEARLALLPNLLTVADALGYAHEQGVVHRDVKPSNIMIGKHGETVLLDWGIAHDRDVIAGEEAAAVEDPTTDPQLTVAGSAAGTVRYMSPEQARGERPVPGFDVFSLGVTIANVLTGDAPYSRREAASALERLRAGTTDLPPLPSGIPADLAAIVAKATAAPGERYPHAGELAVDLRKFIAGQLVSARRYTRRELVVRWIRRHRVLLGASAVALIAIAVISVIAVRSVVRQRNVAVEQRQQAEARERDLILMQARANVRSDPTATLAWLARYPIDAPHQDQVLALSDEAIGRGVARHVWHASGVAAELVFDGDSVISAHKDGELASADLTTGKRKHLASLGVPLFSLRKTDQSIYAIGFDRDLYRWTPDGARRIATAEPRRLVGLFRAGGDAVKIAYADAYATYIGGPPPATKAEYGGDDTTDVAAIYQISANHELQIVRDGPPRTVWTGVPAGTWIRSAPDASTYAALVPAHNGGATLWVGKARGSSPEKIADLPACGSGANSELRCEVAERDPRYVALARCNVLHVFDVEHHRELALEDPFHVQVFQLSHDARWLVVGRTTGVELMELATGISHWLAAASSLTNVMFSSDDTWLVTSSHVQGSRAWDLRELAARGAPIGDSYAPDVLFNAGDQVGVQRHLQCGLYDPATRGLTTTFGIRSEQIRDPDNDVSMWPVDASADGRTCMFEAKDGAMVVARADGSMQTMRSTPLYSCVLSPDGKTAYCTTAESNGKLITFATETGEILATRDPGGNVRATVRFHGQGYVLVARDDSCTLETFAGERAATLAAGCRFARLSTLDRPGHETAIVIDRPGFQDVWMPSGLVTLQVPRVVLVEVSATGMVAVWNDRTIDVWDHGVRRSGPPAPMSPIQSMTWSPTGLLAAIDEERVHVWDPVSGRERVIVAPHTITATWRSDGRVLYTSDGRVIQEWPVDIALGADPQAVRARIQQLTTAVVVGDQVETP